MGEWVDRAKPLTLIVAGAVTGLAAGLLVAAMALLIIR